MCRSRRELSNAYLLAKIGVDTAENEPCKVCPLSVYRSPRSVSALPRDSWSVPAPPLPYAIDAGLLVLTNGLPRSAKQVQAGTFLVHNIFGKRLYALSECIYGIGSKRKCIAKGSLFARMRVGELALPLSLSRENISRYIANISQYANISLPISLSHSTVFVTLALLFHFWI